MGSSLTASPPSPSGNTHFSAQFLQSFADIPNLLCWKGSTADTRKENISTGINMKIVKESTLNPHRVVYDLTTPMMFWISKGLRARPEMHPLKYIRACVAFLWILLLITLLSNCSMCRMDSCRNPRQEAMLVSFLPKRSACFLA